MEIFAAVLLTWTFVGVFQWFSWVVKVEACDNQAGDVAKKIDSGWQWFWGGPIIWLLRFMCYFVR